MPAGAWTLYNAAKFSIESAGSGDINLASDAFKIALFQAGSNVANAAYSAPNYNGGGFTNEPSTANGYTVGGVSVTTSISSGGSLVNFLVSDPSWTITGAGLSVRTAVIYDNTQTLKPALAFCLLDAAPADIIVVSGNTLKLFINSVLFSMG